MGIGWEVCSFLLFLFVMGQIIGWTLKSTRWKYRALQLKSWGFLKIHGIGFLILRDNQC